MAITSTAIPPVLRKTLLEWIEFDDGDQSDSTRPVCSSRVQDLHARIALETNSGRVAAAEPLAPPCGLCLPPLG